MKMSVPFKNMDDIIYCHDKVMAKRIVDFLRSEGHAVGLSSSQIETVTHGTQYVKRIDVYRRGEQQWVK